MRFQRLALAGLIGAAATFAPQQLFAFGEQGAVYDPSDLTTMFQDSAGTTPVTAVGQPVGLILDTRLGTVRGAEMFADATVAFLGGAARVSPNVYRIFTADGTNTEVLTPAGTAVVNAWYEVAFNIDSVTTPGAGLIVDFGGPTVAATVGPKRAIYQSNSNAFGIKRAGSITDIQISGLSFRPLPGNHATQPTAASRPVLSARYNKCTNSNANPVDLTGVTLGNATNGLATLTVVNDAAALAAAGLSSICTSGNVYKLDNTAGDTFAQAQFTAAPVGNTTAQQCAVQWRGSGNANLGLSNTVSANVPLAAGFAASIIQRNPALATNFLVVRAQPGAVVYFILNDLREACDAYLPTQVVTAAGTYDTLGFPYYLSFDGVDDGLVTGSLDFTGTDKMTVWAGLTKLSDAARGAVVDLSASPTVTPATFSLEAPGNALNNYAGSGGGSSLHTVWVGPAIAAPDSSVVTLRDDIGGSSLAMRRRGADYTADFSSQGTGTFAAAPLYIGRRGGTSTPFLGRLYGLIVRGAATADPAPAERWIAQRMGMAV